MMDKVIKEIQCKKIQYWVHWCSIKYSPSPYGGGGVSGSGAPDSRTGTPPPSQRRRTPPFPQPNSQQPQRWWWLRLGLDSGLID
jgi:hypothetical protein